MPTIALLHHIERAGFRLLGTVQHHVYNLRREYRPVLFANHMRRGHVAPSGVGLRARVHAEALVGEGRGPVVCFGGGGGRGGRFFWRRLGRRSR